MGPQRLWFTLVWTLALLHGSDGQRVRCDTAAEVVFVLDASKSIRPSEWEQEKDFVGILIDSMAVEEYAVNVGVVVYSTYIGQVVHLQPFKSRAKLKTELPKLVQTREVGADGLEVCTCRVNTGDCRWSEGSFPCKSNRPNLICNGSRVTMATCLGAWERTDTARGIARMRQMMQNQARDNAKKIAVVITDGRSDNATATIQEAVYARQLDGITMIALGVGNETFRDELEEIAKSDYYPGRGRLFTVTSFSELSELQGVVEELQKLLCVVVPETTTVTSPTTTTSTTTRKMTTPDLEPISCPRPADVLFLLDGSHSITDHDWALGRMFVTTLINSLEVDQEAIHAGIIVYSSNIGDTVPLKPFLDKASLKAKASALNQPPLGRTNTSLGLRRLRDMFREQGREGIPHIGLVITDGQSSNVQDTMDESALAKAEGIVLVVVGVGEDTLATELEAMATSIDTLFNVTDFSALFDIVRALREIICISTDTSTTSMTTTTTPTTTSIPDLCQECLVKGGVGYNSYPPDCSKYVVCSPKMAGGYKAEVRDCPFGLFWSTEAVACVDAAFVDCPADPCRGRPDGWKHAQQTRGCGEYWECGGGGHSHPNCCPQGQRYSSRTGCAPDSSCRDQCTLQWTLEGSGSCTNRPNPGDPFSFLQVKPGHGHVVKPCTPGAAYIHSQCACVHHTSALGCVPSIHYTFDGTFDDKSVHRHAAHVERVLLTRQGTAYFNRTGHVRLDTVPRDEFQDRFVLKIRYRVQPEHPPKIQWNDHYKWGLQEWFNSHQSQHHNLTFHEGQLPDLGPEPSLPSGQKTSTLEKAVILHNGTVVHSRYVGPDPHWPHGDLSGLTVTKHHLGAVRNIGDTAVTGGVVYVPNRKRQVLVLSPAASSRGSVQWEIVSKEGRVMKAGQGQVPDATADAFQFRLKPDPTLRWFITTADGTLLNSGTGPVPQNIKNLFSGFKTGKLVKVYQIGETTTEWKLSRPDGSGVTGGKGPLPDSIRQQLKLDEHLKPESGGVKRWAVLSSAGDVLDTGTGNIPSGVLNKYSDLRSGLVLTDTSSLWQLTRTDGTPLLSGSGTLPPGVKGFLKGSMVLPTLVEESSWTVTLPNGTVLSGRGPIPDHIRELFEKTKASRGYETPKTRWYMVDGQGTILGSGYGQVPQSSVRRQRGRTDVRVVQQSGVPGSKLTRWELRSPTGTVVAKGEGQPPTDVFKIAKNPQTTILSGANVPRHRDATGGETNRADKTSQGGGAGSKATGGAQVRADKTSQGGGAGSKGTGGAQVRADKTSQGGGAGSKATGGAQVRADKTSQGGGAGSKATGGAQVRADKTSQGGGAGSKGTGGAQVRRWAITMPDGSQRTGVGDVPADLRAMLNRKGVETTRRWTVTLPDGSRRSGVGEIPAEIQALLGGGAGTGVKTTTTRRWTVTMPDGSTRSGTGAIPADLQALLDAQARQSSGGSGGGRGRRIQRQWSVTLPNGTVTSGTGDMPAHLEELLKAQRMSGGVRTQKKWTVTLPDGSTRSGVGTPPADLASLLQTSGPALSRGRRATNEQYQDMFGNCGHPQVPSFLLSTSEQHVRLVLRTTRRTSGATLILPITQGMNDVQFIYDGKTLTGVSNGVQKAMPLTGSVVVVQAPITIGRCRRSSPGFRGEIDEISVSSCLP